MKKHLASLLIAAAVLTPGAYAQTPATTPAVPASTQQIQPAQPAAPSDGANNVGLIGGILAALAGAGGLVFFLRRKGETPQEPVQPPVAAAPPVPKKPAPPPGPVLVSAPPDFDSEAFLHHAKASFVRMQAAWDKADSADLGQFTTPQIFAELNVQVQQRGPSPELSEVVTINAELLGCESVGTDYIASVKFTGTIKPAPAAPAEAFAEVWNMSKPMQGTSGWVLAGIQQLS